VIYEDRIKHVVLPSGLGFKEAEKCTAFGTMACHFLLQPQKEFY